MPTVPIVPPRIAELDDEREYNRINLHILRNTAVGNFFDRCAISLPCHRAGEAPVGLMLMGETMGDARLFSIAAAVEAGLSQQQRLPRQLPVRVAQLMDDREVIGARHRDQRARQMRRRALRMQIAAVRHQRRQFAVP